MASVNNMIAGFAAALAASDAIMSWSRIHYDQGATIMENVNPRDMPSSDDCPLVIVFPVAKSGGLENRNKIHSIGVHCAVYDSETPESIEGVVRFTGGRMVEELRGLCVTVIKENLPSNTHMASIVTEYDTIEQFPYVSAKMEITITEEKLIGADPIE